MEEDAVETPRSGKQQPDADRTPRILVIQGHPRAESLSAALADAYGEGARSAGAEVRRLDIHALCFARDVTTTQINAQRSEPDVAEARRLVAWADHLVFVYPTWWGTFPGMLKSFLDRVFVPGFAFNETTAGTGFEGLLAGRSAHLITTMDTPIWVYRWVYGRPGHNALGRATLGFCGIAPVRVTAFSAVKDSTKQDRQRWVDRVRTDARALRGVVPTRRDRAWSAVRAWLRAMRLQFYPMTWLAYTVGALLAERHGVFAEARYWLGYLLLFILELITVFVNEREDFETDRRNEYWGPLTGGSRVLTDGSLESAELGWGVVAASACGLAVFAAVAAVAPSPAALTAVFLPLAVLAVGYTLPPLRLSYRTLGEVDVAATHSLGVLMVGYVLMGGSPLDPAPWLASLPLGIAVLPSIILAGLPDHGADAAVGKKTLAVRFGPRGAMNAALAATLLSMGLALAWDIGAPGGVFDGLAVLALPHGAILAGLLARRLRERKLGGRVDGTIVVALSYLMWFAAVPFYHLV